MTHRSPHALAADARHVHPRKHRPARHLSRRGRAGATSTPIPDAALAWEGDTIRWVGPRRELPPEYAGAERLDAGGRLVIPGLVDCHTHLAFGGWRAEEFEQRILGPELPRDRGGAAAGSPGPCGSPARRPQAALVERSRGFLREMARARRHDGRVQERLRARPRARARGCSGSTARSPATQPVRLVPTFLGAHVVPPEFRDDRAGYVALLVDDLHPARSRGSGSPRSATSSSSGRPSPWTRPAGSCGPRRPRASAPSFTPTSSAPGGGAELAAEVGAVSADHLECTSEAGIAAHGAGRGRGGEPAAGVTLFGPAAGAGAAAGSRPVSRSRWPPTSIPARPRATTSRLR